MSAVTRSHYQLFALCFLSVALGAMDSVLSSAYLPDIVRSLAPRLDEAGKGTVGAWINFAFLAGATLGGIAFGFLSDHIGRRTVLILALGSYSAGSAAGALAGSWEVFAFTRLLVGAGVGAALVVSAVLVSENWEPRSRAVALGILSVAYPVGIIASGTVTTNVTEWRTAFWLGASALLLILPLRRLAPGPPGQSTVSNVSSRLSLKDHSIQLFSGILIYGTMLLGLWAAFSWLPTWVQSLLGDDLAEGQSKRGLSMTLLGMGGLGGGLVSGFLANRFGHRQVQAICFIVCLLTTYGLFQAHSTYTATVPLGIGLLGICFGISQGVLNDYIPGLFPGAVRAAATGLCFHTGRAFTAAAVFFVGALVVWFGGYGNAIFAFSLIYIPGLAALYFVKNSTPTD